MNKTNFYYQQLDIHTSIETIQKRNARIIILLCDTSVEVPDNDIKSVSNAQYCVSTYVAMIKNETPKDEL